MAKTVRIGLMGLGTVGSGLVSLIERNAPIIERRSDVKLEIARALVKGANKKRPLPEDKVTLNPRDIFDDPSIDIVVEVIGGIEPARTYLLEALKAKKNIVTANKAVLAAHGDEILALAGANECQVGFEASVCGGIPIIQALSSGLIANRVDELIGILNGTSNYILTRMSEEECTFDFVLSEAQEKGLAEADPSFDVQGIDAAHKLLILAELTFQVKAQMNEITVEGIDRITPVDIKTAHDFGFVIKPIAIAVRDGDNMDLRVHPALLPKLHPLASVHHEFNAVLVKGDAIGEMIFYGKGAGSLPTASAVLSDIVEIARSDYVVPVWNPQKSIKFAPIESKSRYYLRFPIYDKPGMIGKIATVLGDHGISITHAMALLECNETNKGNVMIVTHASKEQDIRHALADIQKAGTLTETPLAIRMLE